MTDITINDTLIYDQTAGLQDDDTAISSDLTGLATHFKDFLNGLAGDLALSVDQLAYADNVEAAVSGANYVTVTPDADTAISDLFFSDENGDAFNGTPLTYNGTQLYTTAGDAIFLYSVDGGNIVLATTGATAGTGDVVAAFYLNEASPLAASVEMVSFIAIAHPDSANPDDRIDLADVLHVSAAGSMSFPFDALQSGASLWVAVGSASAGVLVTGGHPVVASGTQKMTNASDVIHVSQGGDGTTIGVNNQLFDNVGETGVFTLVSGLTAISGPAGAAGVYAVDPNTHDNKPEGIDYSGYLNVQGAGIYISQSQGSPASTKDFDVNLFTAGGGVTPEEGAGYIPGLASDTPVNVATITVTDNDGNEVGTWGVGGLATGTSVNHTSTAGTSNVVVSFSGNNIDVNGVYGQYTVSWTSVSGETFNRFTLVSEAGQFDVGRVDISEGVTTTALIGDTMFIDDDGPGLSGASVSEKVVEDELSGAGGGDLSTGISDGDGDSDEAVFTNAELQAVVSSGTDEPATFSLNLGVSGAILDTSGAAVTSQGYAMTWNVSAGVVRGMANGQVIFSITQSAGAATPDDPSDDEFSVDLKGQIDHLSALGDDALLSIDLTPAFVAKDADGDAADLNGALNDQKVITLSVENDVPTIVSQIADSAIDFVDNDSTGPISLNGAIGGDAVSSLTAASGKVYTFDSYTTDTSVIPGLTATLSADGTALSYYSGSTLYYDIVLGQSGAGSYTFTAYEPAPNNVQPFNFNDLPSGQNLFGVIAADKADLHGDALMVISQNAAINGAGQMTNVSGTINTSKGGGPVTIGDTNQMYDPGEGVYFAYLNDPKLACIAGVTGGLNQTSADDADTLGFADTHEVESASFSIVQVAGKALATLKVSAFDIDMAPFGAGGVNTDAEARAFAIDPEATDDPVNITGVRVVKNGVTIEKWEDTGTIDGVYVNTINNGTINVTFAETSLGSGIYTAQVSGLSAGCTVEFDTETPHDLALIQDISGRYDIGGFNWMGGQDTPDQLFDFSVNITDYDGDQYGGSTVEHANFSVTVDGTGVFNDPLVG